MPEYTPPVVRTELVIMLSIDGAVGVKGPINDKDLCDYLLDEAKKVIVNYNKRKVLFAQRLPQFPTSQVGG